MVCLDVEDEDQLQTMDTPRTGLIRTTERAIEEYIKVSLF